MKRKKSSISGVNETRWKTLDFTDEQLLMDRDGFLSLEVLDYGSSSEVKSHLTSQTSKKSKVVSQLKTSYVRI
jgi:hypothetical protein